MPLSEPSAIEGKQILVQMESAKASTIIQTGVQQNLEAPSQGLPVFLQNLANNQGIPPNPEQALKDLFKFATQATGNSNNSPSLIPSTGATEGKINKPGQVAEKTESEEGEDDGEEGEDEDYNEEEDEEDEEYVEKQSRKRRNPLKRARNDVSEGKQEAEENESNQDQANSKRQKTVEEAKIE